MTELLVIVIDDDQVMHELHQEMINDFLPRADIFLSDNAIDVLDRMDEFLALYKKVICITDNDMPVVSGFQFVKRLHQRQIILPTVMISGSDASEEAKKIGIEYIEKPFREEELETVLTRICQ